MKITFRIWFLSSLFLGLLWVLIQLFFGDSGNAFLILLIIPIALIASLPTVLILATVIYRIGNTLSSIESKYGWLLFTCFCCSLPYGILCGNLLIDFFFSKTEAGFLMNSLIGIALLFCCNLLSVFFIRKRINAAFISTPVYSSIQNNNMEIVTQPHENAVAPKQSNKILIKGAITGILILVLLIPVLFVSNLVTEREHRQAEVVEEVSSKWASSQKLTGPYIYIPYIIKTKDDKGKEISVQKKLIFLPENLNITGTINPEIRPRSIYKVLLYKSNLKSNGDFNIQIPKDIELNSLQMNEAKICFALSDFKGIEEKLSINFNGSNYELAPGLPSNDIDSIGLSAPVNFSINDLNKKILFDMSLKLKGSEGLHFIPLSGNSVFTINSSWPNPSFDGNSLPSERKVNENGFEAKWIFSKANLPFSTVLKDVNFKEDSFSFGVAMLQPSDQYGKTMRSVKYAILFIGLTFALFFIIEVMQKKPLHPIQYVMVGMALIIFFTLLLSISEFILFDWAYLIASSATIILIALYAKAHFKNWKTASVFAGVLTALYGFIFILIRLEDTALLVGSIGLFIVMSLIMFASRKINWYNPSFNETN